MIDKKMISYVPSPYDLSGMKHAMQHRRPVRIISVSVAETPQSESAPKAKRERENSVSRPAGQTQS